MHNYIKEFESICTSVCFIESRGVRDNNNGIVGEGIVGTGFLIRVNPDDTALIITAKHVVKDYSPDKYSDLELGFSYVLRNGIPTYSRGVMEVVDIRPHSTHDVSLIIAKPVGPRIIRQNQGGGVVEEIRNVGAQLKDHAPLLLGTDKDIKAGAIVMILGYGKGTDFVFLDDILGPGSPKSLVPLAKHGMISQVVPADAREAEVFIYDIQTADGFSGSPVILCGETPPRLIGVHTHGLSSEDVAYSHPVRFIEEIVASYDAKSS